MLKKKLLLVSQRIQATGMELAVATEGEKPVDPKRIQEIWQELQMDVYRLRDLQLEAGGAAAATLAMAENGGRDVAHTQ